MLIKRSFHDDNGRIPMPQVRAATVRAAARLFSYIHEKYMKIHEKYTGIRETFMNFR